MAKIRKTSITQASVGYFAVIAIGAAGAFTLQNASKAAEIVTQASRKEGADQPLKDEAAIKLLRQAAQQAVALGAEPKSPSCLIRIARAQADAGDRESAASTLRKALSDALLVNASGEALRDLAYYQIEIGEKSEARATLKLALNALETKPLDAGSFPKYDMLIFILQNQVQAGDSAAAKETLKRVREAYEASIVEPRNRNRIYESKYVGALASAGEFEEAFAMIGQIRASPDRARLRTVLLAVGEFAFATTVWDRATVRPVVVRLAELLERIDRQGSSEATLFRVADALARVGELEAATKIALSIGEGSSNGQAYALFRVASQQKEVGDRNGAKETLRLGSKAIQEHPSVRETQGRLAMILLQQAKLGDIAGAEESLAFLHPEFQSEPLIKIALAKRAAGDEAGAKAAFERTRNVIEEDAVRNPLSRQSSGLPAMTDEQAKLSASITLASLLAISGDRESALKLVRAVPKEVPRTSVFNPEGRIARAFAAGGDLASAIALVRESDPPEIKRSTLSGAAHGYHEWLEIARGARPSRAQP
jgi:tetratricopeptide (TPR) repeat protein